MDSLFLRLRYHKSYIRGKMHLVYVIFHCISFGRDGIWKNTCLAGFSNYLFRVVNNSSARSYSLVNENFIDSNPQQERICLRCRSLRRYRLDPWVRKIPWSGAWQPTLVFLPGKLHGQRSLVGCSLQVCKESNRSEAT